MTTVDAEPVAGPSHGNSHVMQMTSEFHLYPSQQLQSTAICLPLSVQHLTYMDDEFHDDGGDDGDDDGVGADDGEPQVLSVNSEMSELLLSLASPRGHPDTAFIDHTASTSTNVPDSTTVRSHFTILYDVFHCVGLSVSVFFLFTKFLAHLLLRPLAVDRCFYFPVPPI